jgi:hypothetical protein
MPTKRKKMNNVTKEEKDFDQCALIVCTNIAQVCATRTDPNSLDGKWCLGPNYTPTGKPLVTGVGLDSRRCQDLWERLNHFLHMVGATKELKQSQVDAKTTISSLVNTVYRLWP